jgi:hypothetical protein
LAQWRFSDAGSRLTWAEALKRNHVSTTDPEARLYRRGAGKEAKLSFIGHAMTENRNGLVVEAGFTQATGTAEREEAKEMIERHSPGSTRRLTVVPTKVTTRPTSPPI